MDQTKAEQRQAHQEVQALAENKAGKEPRMKKWDAHEQEYAFDHGWRFDENETLVLTQKQFDENQYTGRSIHDPSVRTLMLPSVHGCCLIFEGKHFRIEG